MPMAVLPCLMASREYSTWKRRPSGEKVLVGVSECTEEGGVGRPSFGEEGGRGGSAGREGLQTYLTPRSRGRIWSAGGSWSLHRGWAEG